MRDTRARARARLGAMARHVGEKMHGSCGKALRGCVRTARRNRDPERGCAGLASYNNIFTNSSDYAGALRPRERHEKNDAYAELEGARRNRDGKGVT